MRPWDRFPADARRKIAFVLADIDGTLTVEDRLTGSVLSAMERLGSAGIEVVPITGRPAGWCDHIARMWPVAGVVGENGAFWFRYDPERRVMVRRHARSDEERAEDRARLSVIRDRALALVPGAAVAADQPYREADLAIDFREDVPPLPIEEADRIANCFREAEATAKISSIHVNGWFGEHDKLSTTRRFFREVFDVGIEEANPRTVFVGDSPNDAPMFAFFENSVGVANVREFEDRLEYAPAWVTAAPEGRGFVEVVDLLLDRRD